MHNICVLDAADLVTEGIGVDPKTNKQSRMKFSEKLKFKMTSYALAPNDRKEFIQLEL